jgi:hypothetical protein
VPARKIWEKYMDPNEFLPATRTEFHRTFLSSIEAATPHTLEALFKKAEAARSSTEQRDYLHASMRLRQAGKCSMP